jgi:hypothetical protein
MTRSKDDRVSGSGSIGLAAKMMDATTAARNCHQPMLKSDNRRDFECETTVTSESLNPFNAIVIVKQHELITMIMYILPTESMAV